MSLTPRQRSRVQGAWASGTKDTKARGNHHRQSSETNKCSITGLPGQHSDLGEYSFKDPKEVSEFNSVY